MNYRLILSICVLTFLMSCKTSKKINNSDQNPYSFDFIQAEKLSDVVDLASKNNKLVFVDVYTDWCLPCKMMDEEVFSDRKLGDFFNEHFVSYKVNAEKGSGPIIAELYEVLGYPTLLFLGSDGNVLVKKAGVAYEREMYRLAEEALSLEKQTGE